MVENQKTMNDIQVALIDFVGDDMAFAFVQW